MTNKGLKERRTNGNLKDGKDSIDGGKGNGHEKDYSFQKIPPKTLMQKGLIYLYEKQIPVLVKIQSIRNPFLDIYMRVATFCGDELFYITFLPFCAWIVSLRLALQMLAIMSTCICFGNMLKNTFCIPRPPHPPVQCLGNQEPDHGFPSTHTMSAVAFPTFFIWWLYASPESSHYPISFATSTFLSFIWSGSIIFSRVYNGHHSLTDVTGGFILGLGILWAWFAYCARMLEYWTIHGGTYAPLLNFVFGAAILAFHPSPDRPTSSLGESGLVTGSIIGCIIALWGSRHFNLFPVNEISSEGILSGLFAYGPVAVYGARMVIGLIAVVIVRTIAKAFFTYLIKEHFPLMFEANLSYKTPSLYDTRSFDNRRGIDVPVKYLTYITIAITIAAGAPFLFGQLGLRTSVDTSFSGVLPDLIH